jgi:hypothetical protein
MKNVFVEVQVITTRRMPLIEWRKRWRDDYRKVLGSDGLRHLETYHHYERNNGAGTIAYKLRRIDERES